MGHYSINDWCTSRKTKSIQSLWDIKIPVEEEAVHDREGSIELTQLGAKIDSRTVDAPPWAMKKYERFARPSTYLHTLRLHQMTKDSAAIKA